MLSAEIVAQTYEKYRKSFFKMPKEDALDIVKYMLLYNVSAYEAKKRCGFDCYISVTYFSELSERAGFDVEFVESPASTEEELIATEKSVNQFKAKTAALNLKSKKPKAILNSFAKLAELKKGSNK